MDEVRERERPRVRARRALDEDLAHRPWALPPGPWAMFQSWQDLLFAHWPMTVAALRPLVPSELALDLYNGLAWIGLTSFVVRDLHVHGAPRVPGLSSFPELNLRTYVRHGERQGIYFFSLDAGSRLAVLGARSLYRLPYRVASMRVEERDGWIAYASLRHRAPSATFEARYRPAGERFRPEPGTLVHFLVERYALFTVLSSGRVLEGDIHHRPWTIQPAEALIETNGITEAAGLALDAAHPELLHFAAQQDTLVWPPRRATWEPLVA